MSGGCENAPAVGGQGAKSNEAGSFDSELTRVPVDLHEAQRFLDILDPGADRWHFRTFPDSGSGGGKNSYGTLDEVATDLQLDNGNGRGVFVVVNEGGHKDADITRIRAVFADFDGTPMPEEFELAPQLLVESSPDKYHAYLLADGLDVDAFKPTQQNIAACYDSDPSVCNPSRVMRVPGFIHWKGEPFRSRIIHESGAPPHTAAQVESHTAAQVESLVPAVAERGRIQEKGFTAGAGELVVQKERHGDLLKLAARFARQVHFDGLGREAALAALFAEAARGRWTREMPANEIRSAFDGALGKCARGEWTQAHKPDHEDAEQDVELPASRLIEVDVSRGLLTPQPPHEFVIKYLAPRGVVTMMGGHGGTGKSTLALIWCAHVAARRSWGGFPIEGGIAIYISLEDPAPTVLYRLQRIVECYGLPANDVGAGMRVFDGTAGDAALVTEVNDHGNRMLMPTPSMVEVEEVVAGADLIVIDNASDAFDGNENERRQVRSFVRRLARIGANNNAAVVLLAHIDKAAARGSGSGNNYSGSTAWHNSARSRVALLIDGESDLIELRQEKMQFGRVADPIKMAWSESGVLIPHKVDLAEHEANANTRASQDGEAALGVLQVAFAAGLIVTTADSGPKTTWHVLNRLPEMPKEFKDRPGRKRMEIALVALERAKRITREEYRRSNRHPGERWALAQGALPEAE